MEGTAGTDLANHATPYVPLQPLGTVIAGHDPALHVAAER